jgi:hypothetical protein
MEQHIRGAVGNVQIWFSLSCTTLGKSGLPGFGYLAPIARGGVTHDSIWAGEPRTRAYYEAYIDNEQL